ncbi:MAG TPA: 3-methyl-2-oxobutanoate dehydrogenase subunit VorB [Negativicutes bacterium]|nr:3-methyl-2-oxobutanoate dehydrogenase subunit VorB [Negativicutes bacterium]
MLDKILMKGNEAIGEAAILAGCRYYFGYPITPQTEIAEFMARRLPQAGGVYLQAESEIAAINMVYGASGAGARAMTSSSSPGISLKQEGLSYIAGAELPCVVVNVVRCGPGLGGIHPSQADYFQATKGGGHGDYRNIVLAPASVQELFDLTYLAFDLADQYRMTALILGDGSLGQMMEPVCLEAPPRRELPPKTWATTGLQGRSKPNLISSLCLAPEKLEAYIRHLQDKYQLVAENETRFEKLYTDDAELVVVAYGITARIARTAVEKARAAGLKVGLFRPVTLWPFPSAALSAVAETAKLFLTVELSAGQMVEDVRLAVNGKKPVDFFGRMGGMLPSCRQLLEIMQDKLSSGEVK